jgi:hypothetical protein
MEKTTDDPSFVDDLFVSNETHFQFINPYVQMQPKIPLTTIISFLNVENFF